MLMSELIEKYEKSGQRDADGLTAALLKTGPILHGFYTYSATAGSRGAITMTMKIDKRNRGARDSRFVKVPIGVFPNDISFIGSRSKGQGLIDHFDGYSRILKSGIASADDPDDMESLADNLEALAREIRSWIKSV